MIGHGFNGLGARTANDAGSTAPTSASELENCDPKSCPTNINVTTIVSGPFAGSQGATAFDDQVFVPSTASLLNMCQALTPGGALNAGLSDNFPPNVASPLGATGLDATKYSADTHGVTATANANIPGERVAGFGSAGGAVGAELATNTANYSFDPRIRPLYVSAIWTPAATGGTTAGMSIVTRATAGDQTANTDDFNSGGTHGITIRFNDSDTLTDSGTVGSANTISIRDHEAAIATSGATHKYNLIAGKSYFIEAYDDGQYVWGRITQTDDYTNTTKVRLPGPTTADLDGNNQVILVGGPNVNYISDLTVGFPMLAANLDGLTGYIDKGSALGVTGNLTVEAWIRPRAIPGTGSTATIASVWDPTDMTLSDNSFRLYFSQDQLSFGASGSNGTNINETYSAGFAPTLGEWSHVAVTYDDSAHLVSFYVNGDIVGTATSTINASGIVAGAKHFIVGANGDAAHSGLFTGDISDVRVWNTVRTATAILNDFDTRLSYSTTTGVTNLALNWKLDKESGGITSTTAISTGTVASQTGTLTSGATYIGALAVYFRPFAGPTTIVGSVGVCPAGTVAHTYECDFRAASQSSTAGAFIFPSNLDSVFAKVWGGGGGGYSASDGVTLNISAGGGAGYSAGSLAQINSTAIAGLPLDIVVGGGGIGSTTFLNGAGGGGASAVSLHTGTIPGVVGGGGGGASFSNNSALTPPCSTLVGDPGSQCGIGGGGGSVAANTTRASDAGSMLCGGLGGNNGPFGTDPISDYCFAGGIAPTAAVGGTGGGTAVGGASATGAGGNGYNATAAQGGAGAGGGGGGVNTLNVAGLPVAGGGGAGGFETLAYDTILIGGTPRTNDTIQLVFLGGGIGGAPHLFTYTVTASDTTAALLATSVAAKLNVDAILMHAGVIATNQIPGAITVFQEGAFANPNMLTGSAIQPSVNILPTNKQLSGGLLLFPAIASETITGTPAAGDVVQIRFTNSMVPSFPYLFSYTALATDSTPSILAASAAAAISADHNLNNASIELSATSTGAQITISEGGIFGIDGGIGNSTTLVSTITPPPSETVTVGTAAFVSAGTSNGFGGGGGSGYYNGIASNALGQAGLSTATATVSMGATNNTVGISFTNSAIGLPVTESTTVVLGDTPTSIAERLASIITTNLSADGITAASSGAFIGIMQQGQYGVTTVLGNASTGTSAVTFNLVSGKLTSGFAGGAMDFDYSPSTYTATFTPGRGGFLGTSGSDGAVLLFY